MMIELLVEVPDAVLPIYDGISRRRHLATETIIRADLRAVINGFFETLKDNRRAPSERPPEDPSVTIINVQQGALNEIEAVLKRCKETLGGRLT